MRRITMVVRGVEGGMEVERGIFSIDILGNRAFVSLGFLGYIFMGVLREVYFIFYIALSLAFYIWFCSVYRVLLSSRLPEVL
jgi:hypothetical protein